MFELYAVTDRGMLGDMSEAEAARLCYEGGADVVQLRLKDCDAAEMLRIAKEIQNIAFEMSKFFIVNDRVDIAVLAGADGVHLGQKDIPVAEARRICGDEMIIGASVNNAVQARKVVDDGADYVAVGAVFATSTKPDAVQGVEKLTPVHIAVFDVKKEVGDEVPIVAIGGINRGNLEHVLEAGADCIAVVSAIMAQPDKMAAAKELKTMVLNWNRVHRYG